MKKRVIAVLISAILLYQPLSVSAAAAPDGMTDASKTPAAQNGAWDAWCEEWETIKQTGHRSPCHLDPMKQK